MSNLYHLYIDDSGTRYPDKRQGRIPAHNHDYFALGGILVKSEDEERARDMHQDFCMRWNITAPLHSSEIRRRANNFTFIGQLTTEDQNRFYEELYTLMKNCPVTGIACVIDRPGYNLRYEEKYKNERWNLCKTAFSVCIERSAKFALKNECRLKVFPERCNKTEDAMLKSYYDSMRHDGMPFNTATSAQYTPLQFDELASVLCEFKLKAKSSPMAQLADLYLWPICMGGYADNRTHKRLIEDRKLIDCHLNEEDRNAFGIKYSCWELEKTKAR